MTIRNADLPRAASQPLVPRGARDQVRSEQCQLAQFIHPLLLH